MVIYSAVSGQFGKWKSHLADIGLQMSHYLTPVISAKNKTENWIPPDIISSSHATPWCTAEQSDFFEPKCSDCLQFVAHPNAPPKPLLCTEHMCVYLSCGRIWSRKCRLSFDLHLLHILPNRFKASCGCSVFVTFICVGSFHLFRLKTVMYSYVSSLFGLIWITYGQSWIQLKL